MNFHLFLNMKMQTRYHLFWEMDPHMSLSCNKWMKVYRNEWLHVCMYYKWWIMHNECTVCIWKRLSVEEERDKIYLSEPMIILGEPGIKSRHSFLPGYIDQSKLYTRMKEGGSITGTYWGQEDGGWAAMGRGGQAYIRNQVELKETKERTKGDEGKD